MVQSFFQGASLAGNSDSLVTDGRCRQYAAQDMFAHTHIFLVYVAQDFLNMCSPHMRRDSQSPLLAFPDFPAHPSHGALSFFDPSHEGPLHDPRQRECFGRFAEPPLTSAAAFFFSEGVTTVPLIPVGPDE